MMNLNLYTLNTEASTLLREFTTTVKDNLCIYERLVYYKSLFSHKIKHHYRVWQEHRIGCKSATRQIFPVLLLTFLWNCDVLAVLNKFRYTFTARMKPYM